MNNLKTDSGMERQLNGGPQSGTPESKRKKYVKPMLSKVTFAAERGFASSAVIDGAKIQSTTVEDLSTESSWI